jgi:glycosyltransferase involved in cell wall biosynthesis
MCAGRTVVATEVGGIVDIMGERQSSADGFSIWQHGLTTPSQDVETFARALRYLVERPALRQTMGEQGQRFVRTRLSKQRLVTDIEQLYHELTGRRSSNLNQPRSLQRPRRDEAIVEPSS